MSYATRNPKKNNAKSATRVFYSRDGRKQPESATQREFSGKGGIKPGLACKLNELPGQNETPRFLNAGPAPARTLIALADALENSEPPSPSQMVIDHARTTLLQGCESLAPRKAELGAGRMHGFQFESLGADRFVEVVGIFLADHRDIFNDQPRRAKLIECLDAFVEAGWPKARRLLYRLPELL